jgi:hypothetical protein
MSGNHFNRGLGVELLEIHDNFLRFVIIMMIFLIYRYLTSQEQFLLNFCRKLQTIIHIYQFFYQEFFEILNFCRQSPAVSTFLLLTVSTLFSYFPLLSKSVFFFKSIFRSGQVIFFFIWSGEIVLPKFDSNTLLLHFHCWNL